MNQTPDYPTASEDRAPDGNTSKTPITDGYESRISGGLGHVHRGWGEICRDLELRNATLEQRVLLAETAVTACHAAMLGKVNPKHPAWGCVYAVQDAKR